MLPPLPNTLFTRDSSCWIYNGVSINPMYWPARRREAYNVAAIYRAHPMFAGADFEFWYPPEGPDGRFEIADFGLASLEGGDVMPIGNGAVLIGMSERSQGRMIEQIAKALFAKGAADRVIACVMTKDRAHMHLDTVFTLLDRDKATAYPKVVGNIRAISLRPAHGGGFHVTVEDDFIGAVADALGVPKLHVVETGGDAVPAGARAVGRRQQRRRPRARRRRRLRAQHLHDRQDAPGRRRGRRDRGLRARQGPRRRPLHDLPAAAGSRVGGDAMAAETTTSRWVIAAIVALAVVALLAWARNDPGIDDRDGDPEDVTEVVTDGDTVPRKAAQSPPTATLPLRRRRHSEYPLWTTLPGRQCPDLGRPVSWTRWRRWWC